MLSVSNEYLTAISDYIRHIKTRVYFNGSTEPLEEEIMNAKVSEIGQSSDALTLGDLCSNMATVKFTMPSEAIALEGGYFFLEHGVMVGTEYRYVPMGTYFISEIETVEGSNKYTVKGYDKGTRFEKDYVPTVTLPTTVDKVVKDVCSQCNVTLDSGFTFPNITIETIYEASCKDTIKYMAGLMGKNAKINRDGNLTFYWYEDSVFTIGRNIQHMGGFKKTTEEDIVINSLTSGTEDNVLVSGNGRGITFDNPYMTQSLLDGILNNIKGFTYTPSTTDYRGNPALEIGDVVSVEDRNGNLKNIIISEHEISLTGMKAKINSKGSTEAESVMKQEKPSEKKLKKMYNVMLNAFKDSTDKIIGAKGGHYVIDYDENGHPTGWKIMDTPTLTDNTKLWIFNKNGLGFSADGGKTVKNFAFDLDGNLNANVITTGLLQGENFELDLDSGSLTLGRRGSDGEFTEVWMKVDETGLTQSFMQDIDIEVGGRNYLLNSEGEQHNSGTLNAEFLKTTFDLAPFFDEYGLIEVTLSFDIYTETAGKVGVYSQNGTDLKYDFRKEVDATTDWTRHHVTFTPTLVNESVAESYLAFYGVDGYGSGVVPHVRKVKLEIGNIPTDWTPAPEDTDSVINDLENTTSEQFNQTYERIDEIDKNSKEYTRSLIQDYAKISDLEETRESLSAEISTSADGIKTEVANTYMAITKEEEIYNTVKTMIEQSESDITMTFKSEISGVENVVELNKQNYEKYIRFSEAGIELGDVDSPLKTNISNTEVYFSQNGEKIAYISNSTMYITNAHILEKLTIGREETGYYDTLVRSDKHWTLKYRKGGNS